MSENYSEIFSLFVLGTDGKYTPVEGYLSELPASAEKKAKLKEAKLQNTMSFTAQSIAAEKMAYGLIDIKDANGNLPEQMKLCHRHVVLLDGPDTAGVEVHNITAYGVLAILNAILQDKKKINLVGFSRGAVIIIQIVNYLQSMKNQLDKYNQDNLTADDFYSQILMCGKKGSVRSSGGWIRNRIDYSKKSIIDILKESDNLKKIINFFSSPHSELRMFCLDPVQGPGWNDEKHYQIPKMVKNIEILYHEDERSYGFNPLYPNAQDSLSSYLHIPGFHGIGDGNLFDHQFKNLDISPEEFNLRGFIQNIVFLKIFKFLSQNGVKFNTPNNVTALDLLLNESLKFWNIDQFDNFLLDNYNQLHKLLQFEVIKDWRKSTYTIPQGSYAPRMVVTDTRLNTEPLDKLMNFNIHPNRKFINREHLNLAFKCMLKGYQVSSDHHISIGQIVALLNRLLYKIKAGELDGYFSNHINCQEQSKIAYKNIKNYIENLISMYFKQNLSSKEIAAIKKFYNKLFNLQFVILRSDDSIVRERKIHLIKHINGCIQQSYKEQFMKIFEFIQLLNKFIGSKNIYILDIMINKKNQFSNFQQEPQFYGSERFETIEKLHFAVIPTFYRQLNALIFSCQVMPSQLFVFKMNEDLLKENKAIWDGLIKSLQSSVQNVIKEPKHEDSISQPSTRFINQNLGITMLLTASISLSLAAGLFFTLGPVAMVPCVVMGVIGLLSLLVAGNALCLQDNAFTPPKGFSLR